MIDNIKLRNFTQSDIPRLAELANNNKISKNLRDGFPNPYTENDAKNFIKMVSQQNPITTFAIDYKGDYVGNIGLLLGTDVYRKSAEIGYFLGEPYWNKGIMTKAVDLIVNFGFETLQLERIYTGIFEYNLASQKVLEKCGFIKEAVFRKAIVKEGKIWNELRFAKLKDE